MRSRTYSESYQAELMQSFVDHLAHQEEVAGLVPWVFADFSSHWFPSNPIPYHNCKGLLTSDRRPKQAYFALQEKYRQLEETEKVRSEGLIEPDDADDTDVHGCPRTRFFLCGPFVFICIYQWLCVEKGWP